MTLINDAAPAGGLNGARDGGMGIPLSPYDLASAKDAVEELLTLPAASEADAYLRGRLLAVLKEKLAACKRRT